MTAKRPDAHPLALVRAALPPGVAVVTAGKIWSRADVEGVLARGADIAALGRAGILNPDWPRVVAAGGEIARPPMTRAELGARAVSPRFTHYLSSWKNLVAD